MMVTSQIRANTVASKKADVVFPTPPFGETNAMVGMWFGQFVHPDWDMFQSGHAMGFGGGEMLRAMLEKVGLKAK